MYRPPQKLGKVASSSERKNEDEDDEADMFQDGFISSPQKKNRNKEALFTDTDYTE